MISVEHTCVGTERPQRQAGPDRWLARPRGGIVTALAESEHWSSAANSPSPPRVARRVSGADAGRALISRRAGTCSPRSCSRSRPSSGAPVQSPAAPGQAKRRRRLPGPCRSPGRGRQPVRQGSERAWSCSRRPAHRSRGLRRLLPGAATLAVLASRLARRRSPLRSAPTDAHGPGSCGQGRGRLSLRRPAGRHAVVHRLQARAGRRPEATCGRARTAAPRRAACTRRRAQAPLRAAARPVPRQSAL